MHRTDIDYYSNYTEQIQSATVFILNGYSLLKYSEISNISRTLVGNRIVDHLDGVGALPVGAAPTASSFST